ncbi:acetate--CoA ligase family protein [Brevibacterium luteolum]|uniref:ATP-grasp domain-containing protein n=1 Tax=Brevibacterium luteolum TaxID=199591 RepID=A0A2N6PHC8_9MICO|nr:acetate--CoA ligase family protein [Brevibacterium luteolum]PMB98090.1 hypothetical protein CJ198_06875 [Brevibacterium luteolum]
MNPNLNTHFNPRRVAIVGASEKGLWTAGFLKNCAGEHSKIIEEVVLVNPRRSEVFGRRCWPTLSDVPGGIDHVIALVNASLLPSVVSECVDLGIKAITAVASGLEDGSEQSQRANSYIRNVCLENNITLQGPNCYGFNNYSGAFLSRYGVDHAAIPGSIAVVAHSGQVGAAIADSAVARGIKLSHLVSSGNELVLDTNDYIEYFLDEQVKVIACFLEQIPDPNRFLKLSHRALAAGVPIVVIVTGKTEAARRIAASHTGAIAGADAVTNAFLRRAGCVRVDSPEELVETAGLLASRGIPDGDRVFFCGFSGGAAELYAEEAHETRLRFVQPSDATKDRIADATGLERSAIHNPLDMTLDGARNFAALIEALATDPEVDILVAQGQPLRGGISDSRAAIREPREQAFSEALAKSGSYGLLHETGDCQPGIEVFSHEPPECVHYVFGMTGIKALSRAVEYSQLRAEVLGQDFETKPAVGSQGLSAGRTFTESESKDILAEYGLPVSRDFVARSADEAAALCSRVGYPLVMKVHSPDVAHKSDVGGVRLGISTEVEARVAFDDILSAVSAACPDASVDGVLMSREAPPAVEAFIGVTVDPVLGPAVVVGLGGVFIEIFADVATRMAPVSSVEARQMIRELKSWPLFCGARGQDALDIDALAEAVADVSQFAVDNRSAVTELDVNPVFVYPNGGGVLAVDALIQT